MDARNLKITLTCSSSSCSRSPFPRRRRRCSDPAHARHRQRDAERHERLDVFSAQNGAVLVVRASSTVRRFRPRDDADRQQRSRSRQQRRLRLSRQPRPAARSHHHAAHRHLYADGLRRQRHLRRLHADDAARLQRFRLQRRFQRQPLAGARSNASRAQQADGQLQMSSQGTRQNHGLAFDNSAPTRSTIFTRRRGRQRHRSVAAGSSAWRCAAGRSRITCSRSTRRDYWRFTLVQNGNETVIHDWTPHPNIVPGANSFTIAVLAKGRRLRLLLQQRLHRQRQRRHADATRGRSG